MEKDREPHGGCCPVWGVFLKSHILNWPREAEPFWTLHPLQRGKGHPPTRIPCNERAPLTVLQWAEAVGHLGGRPACPVSGSHPGVVELSEVACLHSKIAVFPGDLLAALLFQPLFLSIPVGKGGAGAHLSWTGLAASLWFINIDNDIEYLLSTCVPGFLCRWSVSLQINLTTVLWGSHIINIFLLFQVRKLGLKEVKFAQVFASCMQGARMWTQTVWVHVLGTVRPIYRPGTWASERASDLPQDEVAGPGMAPRCADFWAHATPVSCLGREMSGNGAGWGLEGVNMTFCWLACMHAKSLQLCLTLCNSIGCSLPGSPVHGIL